MYRIPVKVSLSPTWYWWTGPVLLSSSPPHANILFISTKTFQCWVSIDYWVWVICSDQEAEHFAFLLHINFLWYKESLLSSQCQCVLVAVAPDENHEGITVACGSRGCWSFQSNLERGLYSYHSLHSSSRANYWNSPRWMFVEFSLGSSLLGVLTLYEVTNWAKY